LDVHDDPPMTTLRVLLDAAPAAERAADWALFATGGRLVRTGRREIAARRSLPRRAAGW